MKFFNNLDKASKVLIGSSIIVFILSALTIVFYERIISDTLLSGDIFGTINEFKQDTRLKRSTAIDWRPVTNVNNLHANDSVFTGENSSANLGLSDGSKVTLLPNSLIVIQKNRLEVEAGTIDVELGPNSSPLEIKNANGITVISKPGKYLANANNVKPKELDEIKILSPVKESYLPLSSGQEVELSWSAPTHLKEFQVEIWGTKKDQVPQLLTSNEQSLKVDLSALPPGMINWSVSVKGTPIRSESSFFLSKEQGIKLLFPQDKEVVTLNQNETPKKVLFSWKEESHQGLMNLQISQDPFFSTILHDIKTAENNLDIQFESEGVYFWRVGLLKADSKPLWSGASELVLLKEKKILPLEIMLPAKSFDFTKSFHYIAKVIDQNDCQELQYDLLHDNNLIKSVTQTGKNFQIEKIPNGLYSLTVTCLINKIPQTKTSVSFAVETTPGLKKPKLIKDKNELFVLIFRTISNLLVPSAHAEGPPTQSVTLAWESEVKDESIFEITIIEKDSEKIKVKELIPSNTYTFKVTSPGMYLWRVREKNRNTWGPFSEWGEINALDKVSLLVDPLMVYPQNNETILIQKHETTFPVEFKWKAPHPDFTYTLEVYVSPEGKPIFSVPMKGRSKKLIFKKKNHKVWWKVSAKSRFGNKTLNSELYSFSFEEEKTKFVFPDVVAKINFGKLSGKIDQDLPSSISSSDNSSKMDSGTFTSFGLDFLKNEKTYSFLYALYNGTGSDQEFKKQELSLRYGQPFLKRFSNHHNYYLGVLYSNTTENFSYLRNTNTLSKATGQYNDIFGSFKYLYKRPIGQKFSFEISPDLLLKAQLALDRSTLSLRNELKLNYELSQKFWVTGFMNHEYNQNKASVKINNQGSESLFSKNILTILGLGMNYKF